MSDRERRLEEIQRMISDHSSQLPEGGAERLREPFANMMSDDAWEDDYELPSLVALGVFLVWLERNVLMWTRGFGIGSNGRGSITVFWREGEVRHTVDFLPSGIVTTENVGMAGRDWRNGEHQDWEKARAIPAARSDAAAIREAARAMSDLIRREAAIAVATSCPDSHWGPWIAERLRALPAVQPAPRRASGPIDPKAGFATTGAEERWIADVEAGVYDDPALPAVQPKTNDFFFALPVTLTYTNWRGETAQRTIVPQRVWFGSTDWHPKPQWMLTALDTEKGAERDFALKDFGNPAAQPDAAQCCMCGKKGLSTEEDNGPECELSDGRWVCSEDCWNDAQEPDAAVIREAGADEEARGLNLAIERVTAFLSRTDDAAHQLAVDAMSEDMQNDNHEAEIRLYRQVILALIDSPEKEVGVPLAMGANHNLVCRVAVDTLNVDALSEQDVVCRLQPGKEVMPDEAGSARGSSDTAPAGLSAGGGADPDPDYPGILRATIEGLRAEVADLTRQLQGQPRRPQDMDGPIYPFGGVPATKGGADTASRILRTLENQTARGQRAEHSRIGHCFNEASWHIHLAGFRSRGEAQAALDAILAAQPATKGSE